MSANDPTPNVAEIDLAAIEAELSGLTDEQLAAELLKVRVRQKVQQKKQKDKGGQALYMKKQAEKRKLLVALAKKKGLYDKVNEQAEAQAEVIHAGKAAAAGIGIQENEPETEEETTEYLVPPSGRGSIPRSFLGPQERFGNQISKAQAG